jgi:hypothetical protein
MTLIHRKKGALSHPHKPVGRRSNRSSFALLTARTRPTHFREKDGDEIQESSKRKHQEEARSPTGCIEPR